MAIDGVKDCFASALRDEIKGRKHKGLLLIKPNRKEAEEYVLKAKKNLELCKFYKEKGFDYKLPEEWFYTIYYCALAILSRFGVESRSQRCTALFLKYVKENRIIEYGDEFIQRIMVYKEKEEKSDVDEREKSRYSPIIRIKEVTQSYDNMMDVCKKAISQCEEIVFSDRRFEVPVELAKEIKKMVH